MKVLEEPAWSDDPVKTLSNSVQKPLDPNAVYMNTPDVTRRFGLSWDYLRGSGLTCYRLGHRTVLWKVSDLIKHIEQYSMVAVA